MQGLFVVDAETDGLHGEFLSVAAIVTDGDFCEKHRFYGAVRNAESIVENEWVRENVLPGIDNAEVMYDDSRQLRAAFWQFWLEHRQGRMCLADVPCPVESRLFELCAIENGARDKMLTPYPLFDLSTYLLAKGIDPLSDRQKLAGNAQLVRHDAMDDVQMTLRIFKEIYTMPIPYSYHTFFLPFVFDDGGKITRKEFTKVLNPEVWKNSGKGAGNKVIFDSCDIETADDARLLYNEYMYFNPAARRAIYGGDDVDSVVTTYSFAPDKIRSGHEGNASQARYCIIKGDIKYELPINGIKLKLYNTGVGIICFECEYYGDKFEKIGPKKYKRTFSCSPADVKLINEYGRRIAPACLFEVDKLADFCPDKLGVILGDKFGKQTELVTNLKRRFECDKGEVVDKNAPSIPKRYFDGRVRVDYIADFIGQLLTFQNERYQVTVNPAKADKKKGIMYIQPALDDRMFVSCLVRSDSLSRKLRSSDEKTAREHYELSLRGPGYLDAKGRARLAELLKEDFDYEEDPCTASELYALIAIDPDDSSCQNRAMTRELLDNFLYTRWRDYGTYHAITHHSVFCITGEHDSLFNTVINQFLMHYQQMLCLVLAQRASILSLCNRVAQLSAELKSNRTRGLIELQEDYIAFQNQLLFFEVTPQEQGVELYQRMQKMLYIDEEKKEIEDQLQNLYEATTVKQDSKLNWLALIVSVIALSLAAVPDISAYASNPDVPKEANIWSLRIYGCIAAVCLVIGAAYILFTHVKMPKWVRSAVRWLKDLFSR